MRKGGYFVTSSLVSLLPSQQTMAEKQPQKTRVFSGERMTWISPVTLKELLEVKFKYPQAPIVMGNTSVGM